MKRNSYKNGLRLAGALAVALIFGALAFSACGNRADQKSDQQYICPMHPNIVSDKPGDCPICGMKLVPTETHQHGAAAGGTATTASPPAPEAAVLKGEAKYVCPMHPNIVSDKPDDCPICGMKLVPVEPQSNNAEQPAPAAAPAGERKIKFYRNPMDARQTSPVPMKDEMGMDYIPVYEDEVGRAATTPATGRAEVTIDTARQQLIGLRTAKAESGEISGGLRTVGLAMADPTAVRRTNVRVAGYIEKVYVDFEGMDVKQGDPLFSLYSPEIYAAEEEYLVALRTRGALAGGMLGGDGDALVQSARRKLRLLDVPDAEIRRVARSGKASQTVTLVSPANGVVTKKNVVEGTAVKPGDMPYEITDLATIWVYADVYENEIAGVKVGMPATFTVDAFPGRDFPGQVGFIERTLDPKTRTLKVRIYLKNPDLLLKPEMFGEVTLSGQPRTGLLIPIDAVIPTGGRDVVFVSLGQGRFSPRVVELGTKSGDRVEVRQGLAEGDEVVVRANFLIDSESSLRASLSALGE